LIPDYIFLSFSSYNPLFYLTNIKLIKTVVYCVSGTTLRTLQTPHSQSYDLGIIVISTLLRRNWRAERLTHLPQLPSYEAVEYNSLSLTSCCKHHFTCVKASSAMNLEVLELITKLLRFQKSFTSGRLLEN
jgi:hypothetical protein